MALFSIFNEVVISAWDAEVGKTYQCLECKAQLKLRKGKKTFPHFYHLSKSPSCRLYSKSERHLLIQLQIQKNLPQGETSLEKPFPSIHRIADLCWEAKKIIFEVQCSLISEQETKDRMQEYRSLGYEVIWILDDKLFNKRALRTAEKFLRHNTSYFVSTNFFFYDQLELFLRRKRIKKGWKTGVDFSKIFFTKKTQPTQIPSPLSKRISNNLVFFEGDWISRANDLKETLFHWYKMEESLPTSQAFKYIFDAYIKKPYLMFLMFLLRNENR